MSLNYNNSKYYPQVNKAVMDALTINGVATGGSSTTLVDTIDLQLATNALENSFIQIISIATGVPYISQIQSNTTSTVTFLALPTYTVVKGDFYKIFPPSSTSNITVSSLSVGAVDLTGTNAGADSDAAQTNPATTASLFAYIKGILSEVGNSTLSGGLNNLVTGIKSDLDTQFNSTVTGGLVNEVTAMRVALDTVTSELSNTTLPGGLLTEVTAMKSDLDIVVSQLNNDTLSGGIGTEINAIKTDLDNIYTQISNDTLVGGLGTLIAAIKSDLDSVNSQLSNDTLVGGIGTLLTSAKSDLDSIKTNTKQYYDLGSPCQGTGNGTAQSITSALPSGTITKIKNFALNALAGGEATITLNGSTVAYCQPGTIIDITAINGATITAMTVSAPNNSTATYTCQFQSNA